MKQCLNCKYFTRNPILKDFGWCDFDKVNTLIPGDHKCTKWELNKLGLL